MARIQIEFSDFSVRATLVNTPTAQIVQQKLPFSSRVNRWGEEIYFSIPVAAELEPDARDVVEKSEIGYWPPGRAMAIFSVPRRPARVTSVERPVTSTCLPVSRAS